MNNQKKPMFSIVMPIYNVEKYLASSINSVLSQTYGNFELICVNDGSSDNSEAILASFKDTRIKVVHQTNAGLSAARNTGIRHSQGIYVAFLDSDDLWHKEKLQKHLQVFQNDHAVSVSYNASQFIDEEGNDMGIGQYPKTRNIQAADIICRNPIGNGSAPVIKRSTLLRTSYQTIKDGYPVQAFFDESLRQSEDVEYWLRIKLMTKAKFSGIAQPLTFYRVNGAGLSADTSKQLAAWETSILKNRRLDQAFFSQWYKPAKSFQLRYLARRAIQSHQAGLAFKLINQSIATNPAILLRDPARTLFTYGCAIASCLPDKMLNVIHTWGLKLLAKNTRNIPCA